jgi:rubrerythrin
LCIGTSAVAQTKLGNLLNAAAAVKGLNAETVGNLQAGYHGESNASAQYTAFAKKADEEGYKSVAALFRAASASEGIHAARFADVLKAAGVEPKMTLETVEVKTTEENIKAAIAGETGEFTDIYPKAMAAATAKGDATAAKSFKDALTAEKNHAKFYAEAAANLLTWKDAGKSFLVCMTCGYTITSSDTIKRCILCGVMREKFETFK